MRVKHVIHAAQRFQINGVIFRFPSDRARHHALTKSVFHTPSMLLLLEKKLTGCQVFVHCFLSLPLRRDLESPEAALPASERQRAPGKELGGEGRPDDREAELSAF